MNLLQLHTQKATGYQEQQNANCDNGIMAQKCGGQVWLIKSSQQQQWVS